MCTCVEQRGGGQGGGNPGAEAGRKVAGGSRPQLISGIKSRLISVEVNRKQGVKSVTRLVALLTSHCCVDKRRQRSVLLPMEEGAGRRRGV